MESETKLDELFKKKLCYIKIIGLLKKIKREWDSRLIIKKKRERMGGGELMIVSTDNSFREFNCKGKETFPGCPR